MRVARAIVVGVLMAVQPSIVPAQTPGGTLVLRNTQWEAVRVEARVGTSTACADNAAVGTRTLRRGQAWGFVTDAIVCWRREAMPGDPTGGWTGWEQVRVPVATRREVGL